MLRAAAVHAEPVRVPAHVVEGVVPEFRWAGGVPLTGCRGVFAEIFDRRGGIQAVPERVSAGPMLAEVCPGVHRIYCLTIKILFHRIRQRMKAHGFRSMV